MTENAAQETPLWYAMEGKIAELTAQDLEPGSQEGSIKRLAGQLDEVGYNVSNHAGNMLELRGAMVERVTAGRPLMEDFRGAVDALTLDDVADPQRAATDLAVKVGEAFPMLKGLERRKDIERMMAQTRLDLLLAHARELGGEAGTRYLIAAEVAVEIICDTMGIDQAGYDEVVAKIAAEKAERKRVRDLLEAAKDKDDAGKVRHLIDNDVAEELIVEMAGVEQATIEDVKKAMEEELAEKARLAEEEAARKKAEAEGPSLDNISDDDMVEFIDGIKEIMEFSDQADEITQMCEQSSIPKCLIEVAVSDPGKLDELYEKAGG